MKKFILAIALCFAAISMHAQDYNWAVGVRGGGMASGLTVKKVLSDANAFEVNVNYWYNNGGIIAGMYEWSTPVIAEGFNLYYGVGAHIGSGLNKKSDSDVATFKIGADAVVGLEYKIPAAPIAISLDYRPFLNVIDSFDLGLYDVGLGLKFCF